MYTVGEGEEQQTFFEVGDRVRIKAQDHEYCGLYGVVNSVIDDDLAIEYGTAPVRVVRALQSQVEAN